MSIDVENRLVFLLFLGLPVVPQGPCPLCHRSSETLVCSGTCQPGEKLFDIGVAVGTASPCEQCEHGSCVGAQIPGAGQSSHGQKQQGQNESFHHRQVARQPTGEKQTGYALDGGTKCCQEPRLV